ncbi:hypothetical protein OV015_25380, partial [Salmonella enterica subsp. enterica serovar 1,4,[5],12:i:-]|nr:hypothetical protein [Salmonella enterica subsp. enterica serovar 1,4,[5],12:i:-]
MVELEYGMEFEYLFGVPDEIPDITRSSGMVRRIRFIYRMSFYVNKMMRKVLWKVLEGSRKVRKKSLWKAVSRRDSTTHGRPTLEGEESQVDSPLGGRPPPHMGGGTHTFGGSPSLARFPLLMEGFL